LKEFRFVASHKVWLVTGDVKAMYTNIPTDESLQKISELLQTHGADIGLELNKVNALTDIISICNQRNYFEFNQVKYRQRDGLAMEIACSPDIANLYAASGESKYFDGSLPYFKQYVPVYVRYIDDVFMVVIADTADEAIAIAHEIDIGQGLEIEWSLGDKHQIFLDIEVLKIDGESSLRWKPYSKPMNRYQRIPWLSSHPKQVKKATYSAELARLARNSSHKEYYLQACEKFRDILLARGWPFKILRSWYREEGEKRWAQRFQQRKRDDTAPPLIIPSTYNLIWESVKMNPIRDAMHSALMEQIPGTTIYDRGVDKGRTAEPEEREMDESPDTPDLASTPAVFEELGINNSSPPSLSREETAVGDEWFLKLLDRRLVLAQSRTISLFDRLNTLNRIVMNLEDDDIGLIGDDDSTLPPDTNSEMSFLYDN
jgi:hypothetical protein